MRYRVDELTGRRTSEIDNELSDQVDWYLSGIRHPGMVQVQLHHIFERKVLVPTYFDLRYTEGINQFLAANGIDGITIGELIDDGIIWERRGHGSPANDQRSGDIPYVKVSDIRALRININPTNLVSEPVAKSHWKADNSGLCQWDLVTPNRASSNIGEFAIVLPGEERIVLTKEVFVFRAQLCSPYDPFYLLWSFSLKAVRNQWRRIALMQTNREDCGKRYREIIVPRPPDLAWALKKSAAFRTYFTALAQAKQEFARVLHGQEDQYTANVIPVSAPELS